MWHAEGELRWCWTQITAALYGKPVYRECCDVFISALRGSWLCRRIFILCLTNLIKHIYTNICEMALDNHFYKVRCYYPNILVNVRRVLMSGNCTSPEHTMTLAQIRGKLRRPLSYWKEKCLKVTLSSAGYRELTDEKFPNMGDPRIELCFLLSTPYIACFANNHGTFHFYLLQQPENKT